MKIEYRTPAGSGGYSTLADDADNAGAQLSSRITGYLPRLAKKPQIETAFGEVNPFVADRGNAQWTLSFTVERLHATADAALAYMVSNPAALNVSAKFDLKITQGSQVVYLAGTALAGIDPQSPQSDRSNAIKYEWAGGNYTNTAP